jgi:alpha-acetolactate decarboxylase
MQERSNESVCEVQEHKKEIVFAIVKAKENENVKENAEEILEPKKENAAETLEQQNVSVEVKIVKRVNSMKNALKNVRIHNKKCFLGNYISTRNRYLIF